MIVGIGTDIIRIARFKSWNTYQEAQLRRIFTPEEIEYALQQKEKSAQRFAVRFAAREAFWKAFTSYCPTHTLPFLRLCQAVRVVVEERKVYLHCNWIEIKKFVSPFLTIPAVHLSLSHDGEYAIAYVIISTQESSS